MNPRCKTCDSYSCYGSCMGLYGYQQSELERLRMQASFLREENARLTRELADANRDRDMASVDLNALRVSYRTTSASLDHARAQLRRVREAIGC